MTFDPARIADPRYFADHRLPAHSDHRWFATADEADEGVSSFEQSLDGLWKFHYAKNLASVVPGFEQPGFDTTGWDDIPVPSHIQLQGYDRPQYVNVQYPWDGYEPVEPGQIPTRYNPVGSYVTAFALDRPLGDGERLTVVFHGAESALAVWLNGTYIGYACDSFTPSEFDLTESVADGENKLAVQVFKWSGASWIEDQDMYRFSGLFRDVVLCRHPACHAEDVAVTTDLADDFGQATVRVEVRLSAPGTITAHLRQGVMAPAAHQSAGMTLVDLTVPSPHLWSAEDPYLYDLLIAVADAEGNPTEYIPLTVGIRRFSLAGSVMTLNGQRIVFKGVNRHEFGLNGRVMTREQTEADIRACKAVGVNAIRTSHYPNNGFFYDLCDRYGLYVIDEMNLESHGLWDRLNRQHRGIEEALPGDRPEWLPALLDRAASLLQRDKNHPCVLLWSCGNESYGGRDILAVSEYFREQDPRRLVHYEGVHWDPRYPETTDVVSQMYTPAAEIEEWLRTHRDKPFILCEYAHAMGNSFGAVDKYTELAYREPLFQGGFIWDFADQAIALKDRYGEPFFGYGGDCGDAPNDAEFSGDGIFFADHSPSPKIQEVRYLYQNFHTVIGDESFTVTNRHLFTSTEAYDVVVSLTREGTVLQSETVETAVKPGESGTYPLPFPFPGTPGEYTIDVSYRLPRDTPWASAGYEVGWQQQVVAIPADDRGTTGETAGTVLFVSPKAETKRTVPAVSPVSVSPELIEGIHNVGVRGPHFTALFSRIHGGLTSYRYGLTPDGGHELLRAVPKPNFWHAPTSNETGWGMPSRDGAWLLASRYAIPDPDGPAVAADDDSVTVTYHYTLPSVPPGESTVSYRVFGNGRIEVTATVTPGDGLPDMPEFGLLMTTGADLGHLRWYGDGSEECYADRRCGARLDVYAADVTRLLTPYLRPQEAGSHTGVRWATLTDDRGNGLRFDALDDAGMEFSALPWTPFEIENAAHHVELPPIHRTVVRPALARRGVGGDNSWGALTHPEYCLPAGQTLIFRFAFQGIR